MLEHLFKHQGIVMEQQTEHLDKKIQQSSEILLRLTGIPAKIKREIHDLLNFSSQKKLPVSQQIFKLLNLYERTVQILATNSDYSRPVSESHCNNKQLMQLSEELQNVISELDFDGESGDLLHDIRSKLLVGVDNQLLLDLTMQALKLVIQGTQYERKTSEQFLNHVNNSLRSSLRNSKSNIESCKTLINNRNKVNSELVELVDSAKNSVSETKTLQAKEQKALKITLDKISTLTELLVDQEKVGHDLIERMNYGKNQIESLSEVTQDYRRRLEDQAKRMLLDPLTKVYNRAAFGDRLEFEYRRWLKSQHPLRVVIFDVDNFKSININFGYAAGDKALKIIARTIKKEISDTDTIARFSGEEFILILPEISDEKTRSTIDNIQHSVSKLPFKFRDQNLTITLSSACVPFRTNNTPEDVLGQLTHALNKAKERGTNQLSWQ